MPVGGGNLLSLNRISIALTIYASSSDFDVVSGD